MKQTLSLLALLAAAPALADQTRQLDAHEHGVGELNIALDGAELAMEFHVPGADIVGFEHAAENAEDRAAINAALAVLSAPLELFVLPDAAGCTVAETRAKLETGGKHHDHDDHDDDHKEHGHKDDHDDDHAHKHEADDHDHHAHADEGGHTEFHATYSLNCADPAAINNIHFAYFDRFENAREVKVQVVSSAGAKAFEVLRDAPVLELP